jgi:hypothetical protein
MANVQLGVPCDPSRRCICNNGRSISSYLTRNLSIYPPIHLSVHLTMYRPIDLPARPFACTSMGLSVSVCLSVCMHAWLL